MLRFLKSVCLALTGIVALAAGGTALAQATYPEKPIRVIIPFSPRGGTDITARQFGIWLEKRLQQNLVIDNRPGAGGTLGAAIASQADPDGYTLLIASASFATAPAMYRELPYDPDDLDPIYLLARQPHLLVVPKSLPPTDLKTLIAYVKARPGMLNYASAGNGSSIHLSTELLKLASGMDVVHVPYRGSGPAIVDAIGGRVQMLFGTMPSLVPQVRAGQLKAIAVSSDKRSPALADVPTIAESGLPGFTYYAWYGLFGPHGTPQPVVAKLSGLLRDVSLVPAHQRQLIDQGLEPWVGTAREFDTFVDKEIERWKHVVAESRIQKIN